MQTSLLEWAQQATQAVIQEQHNITVANDNVQVLHDNALNHSNEQDHAALVQIDTNSRLGSKISSNMTKPKYKIEYEGLTSEQVYDKLLGRVEDLGYQLMPMINCKEVKRDGKYLKAGTLTIDIEGSSKGRVRRFSTGYANNLWDFIKQAHGFNTAEQAVKWATGWLGEESKITRVAITDSGEKINNIQKGYKTLPTVPVNAIAPNLTNINKHFKWKAATHKIDTAYEYKTVTDDTIGYVVRLIAKDGSGKKETLPLAYVEDNITGKQYWRAAGLPETYGKPIYGAEKLADTSKTVLIVEGEKAADAAAKLLPEFTVVSWLGGSGAADKVDWQPLARRNIVIWPDCDAAGMKAAHNIITALDNRANVAMVNPYMLKYDNQIHHHILPEKWDLADQLPEGMTYAHVKQVISEVQQIKLEFTTAKVDMTCTGS